MLSLSTPSAALHAAPNTAPDAPCADASREADLARMMDAYQTALIRMAYLYLGDEQLAQDAVQETFLKAYKRMDGFRGASSEKTWLMRIAINTCKDMRRAPFLRVFRHSVPIEQLEEAAREDTYRDDTVINAVMSLPEKDKQVILLRYYQGMKVAQVAEVLRIPRAAAQSRLLRARDKLRDALKGWYFDEE